MATITVIMMIFMVRVRGVDSVFQRFKEEAVQDSSETCWS